jgi:hypothetical protein
MCLPSCQSHFHSYDAEMIKKTGMVPTRMRPRSSASFLSLSLGHDVHFLVLCTLADRPCRNSCLTAPPTPSCRHNSLKAVFRERHAVTLGYFSISPLCSRASTVLLTVGLLRHSSIEVGDKVWVCIFLGVPSAAAIP